MSLLHAAERREICRIGRSLFERGYVHATAGNISLRLDDGGFLITPTDACLGALEPERLAWVDADGTQRGGDRASKTLVLHRRIYASAAGARSIIHTHSTHLVALTLQGVVSADAIVPPITPYVVMKVGAVPLIAYRAPGHPDVAAAVAAAIEARPPARPLRAVMLERLGPVAWGESPQTASAVLEELEETARLWLLCQPRPAPLDEVALQELADRFGVHW
jgi:3-dehydro-4-phosphotetronate decarboxylase